MGVMLSPSDMIFGEPAKPKNDYTPLYKPMPWFYRYPFFAGLSGGAVVFALWLITRFV